MGWRYRILVSGSLRYLTLQVSSYPHSLLSPLRLMPFFLGGEWRPKDLEGLVGVIMSAKPFKVPRKKIPGVVLIAAGLPIPLNSENPFK